MVRPDHLAGKPVPGHKVSKTKRGTVAALCMLKHLPTQPPFRGLVLPEGKPIEAYCDTQS